MELKNKSRGLLLLALLMCVGMYLSVGRHIGGVIFFTYGYTGVLVLNIQAHMYKERVDDVKNMDSLQEKINKKLA